MLTDRAQIEEIFGEAAAIADVAARAAHLDRACSGDAALRERIEALLAAHDSANSFLRLPQESSRATVADDRLSVGPGTKIGPYKLLEEIGEGGMGVVFMAEQSEPVRRKTALKIIKPGMDSRHVIARFAAERQALAMMDHPNIAKVLDAGSTDSGRSYFAMDLVKGVPITEYCDARRLTPRERLELFIPVCQAVQHAHQKGIIHRDIKPTNVLVAEYDSQPVPKVIDFGVAKAIGQPLTEQTLFTQFGQVIGTFEYMSPEQATFNQLDVDTRSDIYSLGVLLYELLAGSTPIDKRRLRSAALDEVLRIIREEEPPRPSTRFSSSGSLPSAGRVREGSDSTTIAANRGSEPRKLVSLLRGELDWIVMKCLEKDRTRRYESAGSLANDIERYLHDQPVQACSPSATYRLKKFIRRNKIGVLAGSAVVVALVVGLTLASIGIVQARRQARIAVAEAAKATAISDLLQEALQSANPDKARGMDYTVRQLLDDISVGIDDRFEDKPEVEAALHATIGNAYRRLDKFEKAGPHLKAALDLRRNHFGSVSPEVADSVADYAWYLTELGELQRAETTAQEAVEIHRKLVLPDDLAVKVLEASAITIWTKPDKYRELEKAVEQIRRIASRRPDRYPQLATVMHWLAAATTDLAKGEQIAREAVEIHRKLHGENHPETGYGITTLADKLGGQHKLDEAEAYYREGLAILRKHFDDGQSPVVHTLHNLATIAKMKKDQKSLDELRARAAEIASLDSGDWEAWKWRGALHSELSQATLAVEAYSRAIQMNNADVEARIFRGRSYEKLGKVQLAEADFCKAVELGPEQWTSWRTRGLFYAKQNQPDKAQADIAMAVKLGPTEPAVLNDLSWSLATMAEGQPQNAKTAVDLAKRAVAAAPKDGNNRNTLGVAQYLAGDSNAAIEVLKKSMELRRGGDAFDWFFLAMAHWQLGHKEEARKWNGRAVEWMEKNAPANQELIRFRAEAAELLGISDLPAAADSDSPPANALPAKP